MARAARPIWTRKLDLIYLVFFIVHIPVMLVVDLARYYPVVIRPQFTVDLREWYIATYRDRLFTHAPGWFHAFMVLEAIYHVPLSLWAVGALVRDDPLVPLHLLVWAMETAMSTGVCIVEMFSWEDYTSKELQALGGLYGPYLAVAIFMGADMFLRLRSQLLHKQKVK